MINSPYYTVVVASAAFSIRAPRGKRMVKIDQSAPLVNSLTTSRGFKTWGSLSVYLFSSFEWVGHSRCLRGGPTRDASVY